MPLLQNIPVSPDRLVTSYDRLTGLNRSLLPVLALTLALLLTACGGPSSQPSAGGEKAGSAPAAVEEKKEEQATQSVKMEDSRLKDAGITMATAGPGAVGGELSFPGEVALDTDRVTHVTSMMGGMLREVRRNLGDRVRAGDVLAVVECRELAEAKAACLTAKQRVALAEETFNREEMLWKKRISAEQEYLAARHALAEARLDEQAAVQRLAAMGFPAARIPELAAHPDRMGGRIELVAPRSGQIVKKDASPGEVVHSEESLFQIADMGTVWVRLAVPPAQLSGIRIGQTLKVTSEGVGEVEARVSFIEPEVREGSRTVSVRATLSNPDGRWKPGMWVTSRLRSGGFQVAVVVPRTAVVLLDGESVVFVRLEDGSFVPHKVSLGRGDDRSVEVLGGVSAGERYAATGAFTLKAELRKPSAEE